MFSPFQKKVAAAALTCLSLCVIGAFVALVFRVLEDVLSTFSTIIAPVVAALILSFILAPAVGFVSRRLHISAVWSCVFSCVVLACALAGFAAFALPKIADETALLASSAPEAFDRISKHIVEDYPQSKDSIAKFAESAKAAVSKSLTADAVFGTLKKIVGATLAATGGMVSIFSAVAAFAVAPIYLFYMLTSNFDFYEKLESNLRFVKKDWRDDIVFFVRRFSEIMATFFRGQLLVAFSMGLMLGFGLMFAGVRFGFLLGFAAGMINIIPYLGTMIGLGVILPTAVFQDGGGWILAGVSLAIFIAAQLVEAYVLTPRIMGDRTGLHPTVIIFSVFFWGIALNGILGMILAIPLSAFIVAVWDRIIMKKLVSD